MASSLRSLFNPKGKGKGPVLRNLRDQFMTHASIDTKIYASFLAVAMLDALGNPLQGTARSENQIIDEMRPHPTSNRPPGFWSDDTSMMLCVAHAVVTTRAADTEESTEDQILALREWRDRGLRSSIGVCFDITPQVSSAITLFTQSDDKPTHALHLIRSTYCGDSDEVNTSASLSRVLPIGIALWRDPTEARNCGKLSSDITHASVLCREASGLFANLISLILQRLVDPHWKRHDDEEEEEKRLSKLTLLHFIAKFPFQHNKLREYLTAPFGTPDHVENDAEQEEWYYNHVPLLRMIARHQVPNSNTSLPFVIPPAVEMPSGDHALDVTLSVLYCFFATKTFEDGALMAVNLGGQTSTVGAVYASLAAPFYVGEEGKDKLFWTKKVRDWKKVLQRQDLIELEARKIIQLAHDRLEEERQS